MIATLPKPVYTKTLLIGKAKYHQGSRSANCPVEVRIELRPHQRHTDRLELSIRGEVWNHIRSDITAGGQLRAGIRDYLDVKLIGPKKLNRIIEVWERWHLNGMRAGCEHQRAAGTHEAWMGRPDTKYVWGMGYPRCQVCGYSYGSAWLFEELPQEIIDEVKSW